MTDREIIQGLIDRDSKVTEEFLFGKCKPLLCSIVREVFHYDIPYEEAANSLWLYLMEDDAAKLRSFQYRCSVYLWVKVLAIRFFIKMRNGVIGNRFEKVPYRRQEPVQKEDSMAGADLERLFRQMPNKRYVTVIRRLILEGEEVPKVARSMEVSVENLYNIKLRAMKQLMHIARMDVDAERRMRSDHTNR